MDFSYQDNNKQIKTFNVTIGSNWSELGIQNKLLNSIFKKVDDGDNKISEKEFSILQYLFKLADGLVKKTANDKVVDNEELSKVIDKLDSKEINIKELNNGRIDKIDPDDYTLESLKKRYPSDQYDISKNCGVLVVTDKKTNNIILNVAPKSGADKALCITFAPNTRDEILASYDSNGKLEFYDGTDKRRHYPIADDIYKDITAKNKFGLPTTGADLLKHIKQINSDNVISILEYYSETYGEGLEDALNGELKIKKDSDFKNQIMEHLTKCLEKYFKYEPSAFQNDNSQVINKYHKGAPYSVKNNNEKLTIKNKKTGKTRVLDLNVLTQNLSLRNKVQVKKYLTTLPAEVLMDIAIELDSLKEANIIDKYIAKGAAAYYHPVSDNITLGVEEQYNISESLVHELGHAIDYNGYVINSSEANFNSEFRQTFEAELKKFLDTGNDRFPTGILAGFIMNKDDVDSSTYATASRFEMFAECYQYLMTGTCKSASILEDFFPETLKVADKILAKIRSLPDDKRH